MYYFDRLPDLVFRRVAFGQSRRLACSIKAPLDELADRLVRVLTDQQDNLWIL